MAYRSEKGNACRILLGKFEKKNTARKGYTKVLDLILRKMDRMMWNRFI